MNAQEREQLTQLLQQLALTQAAQKDVEADTMIREACIRQADAAYLLVQRVMLLDHARKISQAQIADLQGELDLLRDQVGRNAGESFLDANAWGNSAPTRPAPPMQSPSCPASPAPALALPSAPSAPPAASAWGGGMLGAIATTAAGVVAGGFLFQGIEHLLGTHGASSGLMNGLSSHAATDQRDVAAIEKPVDGGETNPDFFDTSSIDDFISNDSSDTI